MGVLQVVLFTVLPFKWSLKQHCVAKILQRIWERFLYENNLNYHSYKFSYKFTSNFFLYFDRNQKQESNFQQFSGLVTRNGFAFCLQRGRALLQCMKLKLFFKIVEGFFERQKQMCNSNFSVSLYYMQINNTCIIWIKELLTATVRFQKNDYFKNLNFLVSFSVNKL